MRRFILTGTPGSGKMSILHRLEREGFGVVGEAATDVIAREQAEGIAEPWTRPAFIDAIVNLQHWRERLATAATVDVQFHDRSAFCTAALATFLGYQASAILEQELGRLARDAIFQKRVFFILNLGFVAPTEARRISFEEALRFEHVHAETYRAFGFDLVPIDAASLEQRVEAIKRAL